jgi:hypothetical protein
MPDDALRFALAKLMNREQIDANCRRPRNKQKDQIDPADELDSSVAHLFL